MKNDVVPILQHTDDFGDDQDEYESVKEKFRFVRHYIHDDIFLVLQYLIINRINMQNEELILIVIT